LRLRFKQGNDQAIKKYLSGKLKDAKIQSQQLLEKSNNFESVYQKATETNEQLMYDI